MSVVRDFVRTYTPEAETQIAFAWNGKHASEFYLHPLLKAHLCQLI